VALDSRAAVEGKDPIGDEIRCVGRAVARTPFKERRDVLSRVAEAAHEAFEPPPEVLPARLPIGGEPARSLALARVTIGRYAGGVIAIVAR
jgi:hypothetical protein